MMKEAIERFIRLNRYRKAVAYCELCDEPILKKKDIYVSYDLRIVHRFGCPR